MARFTLTTPGEDATAGGTIDLIGTVSPNEVITLVSGVITLDPSFNQGGDVLVFPESSSAYRVVRDGSNVVIRSGNLTVTVPPGTTGIELRFTDETLVLRVENNQLLIGSQVVTSTEAPIDGGGGTGPSASPIDAGMVSEDGTTVNVDLLSTVSGSGASVGSILSATTNTGRVVQVGLNGSTLSINPGQFNDLDTGEAETVTVRYTVTSSGGSVQNEVTLRVTGADDAPTSAPVSPPSVDEDDAPVTFDLLSRASDPDGDPLVVANIISVLTSSGDPVAFTRSGPAGNLLTIDPRQFGELAPGETERVMITYTISDGDGAPVTNTATLTVVGVGSGPDANNDTGAAGENSVLTVSAANGVLANDVASTSGGTLSVTGVNGSSAAVGTQITLASGALLRLNADGSYTYNPNGKFEALDAGETATDQFSYQVTDSTGTRTAQVIIAIAGANDAPIARADSFTLNEDSAFSGNVLTNDEDVDLEALSAILVGGPANAASFTLNANGSFSYTPNANFSGPDSFTYKVNDGTVDGNTVTVSLTVNSVNDAPQGTNGSATTTEDSPYVFSAADFGFSDPIDGNAFAGVVITTSPTNGAQLELNGAPVSAGTFVTAAQLAAGQLELVPANVTSPPTSTFTFQVRDNGGTANGGQDTDQSANTFTLNITAVNDAPTVIAMRSDVAFFREDGPPVRLDSGSQARVFDDSPNFDSGTLSVAITTNEVAAEDRLGFDTSGTVTTPAAGVVAVGGVTIGTYTGGGADDLVFTFNANATPARVEELLRALTYSNANQLNPSLAHRTVSYSLSDGDGGTTTFTSTVIVTTDGDPSAFAPAQADVFGSHGFAGMGFALPDMHVA